MQSQAFSSLEDIPVPLLVCFGSFQVITHDGKFNNSAEVRMQTSLQPRTPRLHSLLQLRQVGDFDTVEFLLDSAGTVFGKCIRPRLGEYCIDKPK